MNNKRNVRTIITGLLVLIIIGLSVAFAALSQQLSINATGTVKGGTWRIFFDNLGDPMVSGKAVIDKEAVLENNSTTLTFAVSLKQPGDGVTYMFEVANGGTIDAAVSSISLSGVTEAELANVSYTLTYDNGSSINVGDLLLSQQRSRLFLTVNYDYSATTLPEEDIELDLGATITYTQSFM